MEGGFSFCGVDIADLGLEYAPENANTYVYSPGAYDVNDESFPAHDGGYFYGTTVKPKDFTLRCFFEGQHLNSGALTRVYNFFKRGRSGRLIFAKRPWCYYIATVVRDPQLQPTNFMNGIITFQLRAYYPFARSDQTVIGDNDPNEQDLINNSAMLKGEAWDTDKDFGAMNEQTEIFVYNPGTENAATVIEIEGDVGSGITIYNEAIKQTCEIAGFTDSDGKLTIDSLNGKVLVTKNNVTSYGFLYHDNGFIDLASNYPVLRSLWIKGDNGSNAFQVKNQDDIVPQDMLGHYIGFYMGATTGFLGQGILGQMILANTTTGADFYIAKITNISADGKSFTTDKNISVEGFDPGQDFVFMSDIVTFNKIVITPKDTMDLDHFVVHYKPTFT